MTPPSSAARSTTLKAGLNAGWPICLLIYQFRKLIHLLTAVVAGLTAVGLALMIPRNTYIVLASIAAATVGVIIQRKVIKSNPNND